jgi:carbon-monoxide dehydrogenase medium subunit
LEYSRPEDEQELRNLLESLPLDQTVWLAGGTDLQPAWDLGRSLPRYLVDLKRLPFMKGIQNDANSIRIGALTTVEEIKQHPLIQTEFGALSQAAEQFAGVQIRHRATVGGNICNASPAADLLPGLYVHDARVELLGLSGKRELSVREFIQGPGKTLLKPGEILTRIILPRLNRQSMFYKLGLRQAMAIAVVNVAVAYRKSDAGLQFLVIAAGAVAPTVVLLKQFTTAILEGLPLREALVLIDQDIAPISDIRATAEYRRKVLKNIVSHLVESLHV